MLPRIALLALIFVLQPALLAQAQGLPEQPAETPRMPANVRLKLAGAGFGGALLGIAGSLGVGVVTGMITHSTFGDEDEDREVVSVAVGGFTALALTSVTMPLGSSWLVHRVGKKAGYQGRYSHALLGAGVGTTLAVAVGISYFALRASLYEPNVLIEDSLTATALLAGAVGIVGSAGLGMLGYRLSDQHRVRFSPLIHASAEDRTLTVGVSGRY